MNSTTQRRHFSPEEKLAILRRHFLESVPISNLCDELGIQAGQFYQWQKVFFENGQAAFAAKANGRGVHKAEAAKDQKIAALEAKLHRKDEVIAELMEDHVRLKKELGDL
jgi:transposase